MEQHGVNPKKQVIAIIPARYDSVRLAGKLLLPLAGKALILHTVERVAKSRTVERIIVATDDARILDLIRANGFEAVMSAKPHDSGTDRIAEAAAEFPDDWIIVNVQADEPFIDPHTIDLAVEALLNDSTADISTCAEVIVDADDVLDPNVVKVVFNHSGTALYFSRAPIPFPRDEVLKHGDLLSALRNEIGMTEKFRKHLGLYAFRQGSLQRFASSTRTRLEEFEKLEQLRALEMGFQIKVVETSGVSVGVDTIEDYERAIALAEGGA